MSSSQKRGIFGMTRPATQATVSPLVPPATPQETIMPTSLVNPVSIRWMIRNDMARVLEIENDSFPKKDCWTEADFLTQLRSKSILGFVADDGTKVHGFAIIKRTATKIDIVHLCVVPESRRQGVGRTILERLRDRPEPVKSISVCIHERNVAAQLFFRACGYRAAQLLRKHYEDDSDAILMTKSL